MKLRLSFKFAPVEGKVDGNSGIRFRSKLLNEKSFSVGGYQADFDGDNSYMGIIYDEASVAGGRGIMSKRGEKVYFIKRRPGIPLAGGTIWTYDRNGEIKQDCAVTAGDLINGVQIDEDGGIYFVNARMRRLGDKGVRR